MTEHPSTGDACAPAQGAVRDSDDAAGDAATRPAPAIDLASLYAHERRALIRFGYLLTGDLTAAEDLVHDAFAALQARWTRLHEPERALGYVRVTMINRSRTAHRKAALDRTRTPRTLARDDPPTDQAYLRSEEQRTVTELVGRLPRRQRQVVALRYWSDLSEAQIAATLGISAGTVKSTASRALAALARSLDEEDTR